MQANAEKKGGGDAIESFLDQRVVQGKNREAWGERLWQIVKSLKKWEKGSAK